MKQKGVGSTCRGTDQTKTMIFLFNYLILPRKTFQAGTSSLIQASCCAHT